ncbi:MAG: hypothetical protein Kow0080_28670 [Candidatus Promineifilaceae bacterium]
MAEWWQNLGMWQRRGVLLLVALVVAFVGWLLFSELEQAAAPEDESALLPAATQVVEAVGSVPPTAVSTETAIATPAATPLPAFTETPAPMPEPAIRLPDPAPLPESWQNELAALGYTAVTTRDLTPEMLTAVLAENPALFADMPLERWRILPPPVLETAVTAFPDQFDAQMLAQLTAVLHAANGTVPDPVPLPSSWKAQASYAGYTIETTTDLTPAILRTVLSGAPEMVDLITPEMVLAMPPTAVSALPLPFITSLDTGIQQTIDLILFYSQE